ncbi:uncharacterized protein L201_002154 [Kwoniella dendrophila CBS 6074]|uniref:Uncharacterized protein n=1 Tax=Kwoniella dendrophila CBS 6074 TaxID=1295534 RepID=A0AAX4JPF0_9TREE
MTSENGNTILLLHPPSINPSTFITRLTDSYHVDNNDGRPTTWNIDNKYYTVDVQINAVSLGKSLELTNSWKDVDVILYIFETIPTSLPATLIKLLSTPRDIALAVRAIPTDTEQGKEDQETSDIVSGPGDISEIGDLLEENGMEFIDEVNPLTEEDDERPMEPLEIIRQTLMTHIWPGMKRKPLNIARDSSFPDDLSPSASSSSSPSSSPPTSTRAHQFPETFNSSTTTTSSTNIPTFPNVPSIQIPITSFPGLDELRAEIYKADYGDIDRLDKFMNDFGLEDNDEREIGIGPLGPSQDEYAKLDKWLDSDDDDGDQNLEDDQGYQQIDDEDDIKNDSFDNNEHNQDWLDQDDEKFEPTPPGEYTTTVPNNQVSREIPKYEDKGDWLDNDDKKFDPIISDLPPSRSESIIPHQDIEDKTTTDVQEGFEDDFEFTEFQSAPQTNAIEDMTLSLDPTPLLLHLQSVRDELSQVDNEDERRKRAGKEVQQILASLGLGDGGFEEDDLGLDEI